MNTSTPKTARSCSDACATPAQPVQRIGLVAQAKVFKALADETRLRILEQLAGAASALCACEVEGCCDLAQPTISHHLKVLREAGLIVGERRGTWIYYSINRDTVAALPQVLGRLVVEPSAARPVRTAL